MTDDHRSIFGPAIAPLLGVMLGGCTLITDSFLTNEFSGDSYPINVETSSGAIIASMRQAGAPDDRVAVLDLLSPITVIDQDPARDPSLSYADLTLLGAPRPLGPGAPLDLASAVPRARFTDTQLVALHPCHYDPQNGPPSDCVVGVPGMTRPFQAILGADALAGDAVRLRLGDNQIFVLPDVGGSDRDRSLDCDAVFDSPYRGGGTLVFPTTELAFGNRRIALQACLGPDPDPKKAQSQRGTDALLVMSTSIGTSILTEAAYERYRIAHPTAPVLASLPVDSVYLPSGIVPSGSMTGHRATIEGLALVATSTSNALAPCRQVYAHHLLLGGDCSSQDDCPCENDKRFCAVPAILELTPSFDPASQADDVDVLVVPDQEPTLQALRTELRPDQPEVDGILGTTAMRSAEIDVDYPHDRLIARCTGPSCSARPQLARERDRCQINSCIYGLADPTKLAGCPAPP